MSGTAIGIIGIAIGLVVAIIGILWTRAQARRSARGVFEIVMAKSYEFYPLQFDASLGKKLEMNFLGTPISNFVCFEIRCHNEGYRDYENQVANQPKRPDEPYRPRIDFDNFRILAIRTDNNDPNLFQIPISRINDDQSIIFNVIRITAGSEAIFSVLGTKTNSRSPTSARLQPGYLRQMDVRPGGILK